MEKGSPEFDRRLFLKRSATVVWATPAILTLMATSAAASHTPPAGCTATGAMCGTVVLSGTQLACANLVMPAALTCCEQAHTPSVTCRPPAVNPQVGQPCTCR